MYQIKQHPFVKDDLKALNNSIRIEVFKKFKKLAVSPQLGESLGNKNGINLSGLKKVYVAKKTDKNSV